MHSGYTRLQEGGLLNNNLYLKKEGEEFTKCGEDRHICFLKLICWYPIPPRKEIVISLIPQQQIEGGR